MDTRQAPANGCGSTGSVGLRGWAPAGTLLRGFGFALFVGRGWAGIFALCLRVAVDELDDRHRSVVAVAITGLDDAGVAAAAVGITVRQGRHQLHGDLLTLRRRGRPSAVGETDVSAECEQQLNH